MKKIILLFQIVSLLTSIYSKSDNKEAKEKCYVLALEGGGDKGAYQAGVLKGLIDNVPNKEVEWDVVTGVSVGSLNAAGLSLFEPGQESAAVGLLLDTWRSIKGNNDVYKNWPGGPMEGLLWKRGLFDNSPLRHMITDLLQDRVAKRKFVYGATNFKTGQFDTWDETTLSPDEYEGAIASSGSYPVIFPTTEFKGNVYMDGGVTHNLNIVSGIRKCHAMNYTDDKIVIDIVLLTTKALPVDESTNAHPLGVLNRMLELLLHDISMHDLVNALQFFPSVKFRYVVAPTKMLPWSKFPVVFRPKELEEMIEDGIEDGKNVVAMGEGKNLEEILKTRKEALLAYHGYHGGNNLEFLK